MATEQEIQQIDELLQRKALEAAFEQIQTWENDVLKIGTLMRMARLRERSGQPAHQVWQQAIATAQAISNPDQQTKAWTLISGSADSFESLKQPEVALNVLSTLPNPLLKSKILLRLGYPEYALQTVETLPIEGTKVDQLIQIAIALVRQPQPERASVVWQQAVSSAQAIEDAYQRAKALTTTIQAVDAIVSGSHLQPFAPLMPNSPEAEVYLEAVQIAQTIEVAKYRYEALYALAEALNHHGQTDAAIALLDHNAVPPVSNERLENYQEQCYAQVLAHFAEERLASWAVREGIETAYRFLYLPSFTPSLIVRVWSNPSESGAWFAIAKSGEDKKPKKQKPWQLSLHATSKMLTAIEENRFWRSTTWDLQHGLDGAMWVFEGWQHGQSKRLQAWSPGQGPAYRLGHEFSGLLPQRFSSIRL